ncbi:MAG: sugar phosphate isomerase/epimerase [Clostridia bacterium]|nr:sugar phosphate isomerase/epimerase [Clostridia bacterium]
MSKKLVAITGGGLQRDLGDFEALKFIKSIGADGVDFSLMSRINDYRNPDSIYSKSDDEIIDYYTKLKKHADDLGLAICHTHGRLDGFYDDEEENEAQNKNARIDCLITSILKAPVCVIHGVNSIKMGIECEPQRMRDLNFEMFNKFLVHAKKYNIQIATETFGDALLWDECDFFGNMDEFLKSYNRIAAVGDNKKYFSVCMDTGHTNKASRYRNNPTPGDAIRMLGDKISVLHLHDNDTFTDQHKIPMTGCIDWNDVFDALDEIGFEGYYNLELFLHHFGQNFKKETAEFAIKVMRNMLDTRYGA